MKNPSQHMKISSAIFGIFLILYFVGKQYFSNHSEISLDTKFLIGYIIVIGGYLSLMYFAISWKIKSKF